MSYRTFLVALTVVTACHMPMDRFYGFDAGRNDSDTRPDASDAGPDTRVITEVGQSQGHYRRPAAHRAEFVVRRPAGAAGAAPLAGDFD